MFEKVTLLIWRHADTSQKKSAAIFSCLLSLSLSLSLSLVCASKCQIRRNKLQQVMNVPILDSSTNDVASYTYFPIRRIQVDMGWPYVLVEGGSYWFRGYQITQYFLDFELLSYFFIQLELRPWNFIFLKSDFCVRKKSV
jgi:hypothetical protein